MATLKVGIMGLGPGGMRVAQVLLDSTWCELVAVCSSKPHRIENFTKAHPTVTAHNDSRSMVVATPLDALFAATPPFRRNSYLSQAAERRIPVWMLTPAARRFEEALEWVDRFEQADCPIAVVRSWGVEPGLQPDALDLASLGRFFFARGSVMLPWDENLDWRGDSERAGGGVLLYEAYGMVDTLVQILGLPDTVYASMAGVSRPGTRFPYDTEDTACVVLRFAGGAMATLSACWTSGPRCQTLELHAVNGSVHILDDEVIVYDRPGERVVQRQVRPADPLRSQIDGFLSEVATSPRRVRSTLRQHLSTVAVMDAAYLSARTGQPESPGKLLTVHDVDGARTTGR